MDSLVSRGSVYMVGTALQLGGALLILPALTRALSPTEYGIVAAAVVIQNILIVVGSAGLPAALVRLYFDGDVGPAGARGLVGVSLITALAITIVAGLTGPLWATMFSGLEYGDALRWAVLATLPAVPLAATLGFLRAQDRVIHFIVVAVSSAVGAQVLGLIGALAWGTGAAYLAGFAVGTAIAAVCGVVLIAGPATMPPPRPLLRRALALGLLLVPNSLALYVMSAGDRVVIENKLGLAAVGRYTVAYMIGAVGIFAVVAVSQAWGPLIYQASDRNRWTLLAESSAFLAMLAGFVAAALAIIGPLAVDLVAPPDYSSSDTVVVTALVAGGVVPFVIYLGASHGLIWAERVRILAIVTPLVAVFNIGLNFALIPPLGLSGAALATLSAYAVQGAAIATYCYRALRVRWDTRAWVAASAVAAGGIGLTIAQPDGGHWVWLRLGEVGVLAIAAVIYSTHSLASSRARAPLPH